MLNTRTPQAIAEWDVWIASQVRTEATPVVSKDSIDSPPSVLLPLLLDELAVHKRLLHALDAQCRSKEFPQSEHQRLVSSFTTWLGDIWFVCEISVFVVHFLSFCDDPGHDVSLFLCAMVL